MKCSEFLEDVGAFALGALTAEEAARMQRHLAEKSSHEGCIDALADARHVVVELSHVVHPVVAGDRLWKRIAERAFREAPPPPPRRPPPATLAATRPGIRLPQGHGSPPRRRIGRREVIAWSIAAAASVAAMLEFRDRSRFAAAGARLKQQVARTDATLAETRAQQTAERERCRLDLERLHRDDRASRELLALLDRPSTRIVRLNPFPGTSRGASAIVNDDEGRYVVVAADMAPIDGKDLELWIIRGTSAPIPAGFLHSGPDNVATGEIDRAAAAAAPIDALAVSLEPTGGSPSPTELLMVGKLHG